MNQKYRPYAEQVINLFKDRKIEKRIEAEKLLDQLSSRGKGPQSAIKKINEKYIKAESAKGKLTRPTTQTFFVSGVIHSVITYKQKMKKTGELHYVANDSDWHIKNRGEYFKRNEAVPFMAITDRGFFTMNQYGISLSDKEWFGIKLTDGVYDEDNEKYYKVYDTSKYLRYTIQYILHWADHMSTVIERQQGLKGDLF